MNSTARQFILFATSLIVCSSAHSDDWVCSDRIINGETSRHCSSVTAVEQALQTGDQPAEKQSQANTAGQNATASDSTTEPAKLTAEPVTTHADPQPAPPLASPEGSAEQQSPSGGDAKETAQEDSAAAAPETAPNCQTPGTNSSTTNEKNGPPGKLGELPVEAVADEASLENGVARFSGDVNFQSGDLVLTADSAAYYAMEQRVELDGNVTLRDPQSCIRGDHATIDIDDSNSEILGAEYTLNNQQMRGKASRIAVDNRKVTRIDKGSYTRCPEDNAIWEVHASSIVLDPNNGQGKAKHARLNVYSVPVFYLPYAHFPVGDQRQSGFLFPKLSDTNSGTDLALPYYFNIAPNADATLSARYKNSHGYITEGEARWLNTFDQWAVGGSYIDADESLNDQARWLVNVEEQGRLGDHLTTTIDYTKVSDADFLRDLNTTSLSINRASTLSQAMNIRYHSLRWDAGARIQRYQSIDDPNAPPTNPDYEQLPELWLNYTPAARPFQLTPIAEARYSQFDNDTLTDGQRSYGHVGAGIPLHFGALQVTPAVGYQHQYYDLEHTSAPGTLSTGSSYGRVDIASLFEKQHNGQVRSFEPRLTYLYREITDGRSDAEQRALFDSNRTSFDIYQLDALSRFAGYDIVEETNQLTLAINHQRHNPVFAENISVTVGQILYFQQQQILDSNDKLVDGGNRRSNFLMDASYSRPNWQAIAKAQWDSENNTLQQAHSAIRFRSPQRARRNILNIGYNFRRADSHFALLSQDIEQAEISGVSYLGAQWGLFGKYQYDLKNQRETETLAGIEYDSCCVQLRLAYREGIVYDPLREERDRSLMLQIEFKGLMGVGRSLQNALDESIHGYGDND